MPKFLKLVKALLLAMVLSSPLFAQTKQITGTVTSSDNSQPVSGVTVTVKGTRVATTTDAQGHYKINVDNKATILVFTNVSYTPVEMTIAGNSTIDVLL